MPTSLVTRPIEIDIPQGLSKAMSALQKSGGQCRVVGGCVRDALLDIRPHDFDIEVYGLDLSSIQSILKPLGKTSLVGKSFCVVKFWIDGKEYDFSIPRMETKSGSGHRGFTVHPDTEMDELTALKRRDFTINALMYDPVKGIVIDHVGGLEDLEKKSLKHAGQAFNEDPLRVLRAVQFAGRYGLSLDPDTAKICYDMKREFWTLPKERIWGEWQKWATKSQKPSCGLDVLEKSGWIAFFPELNSLVRLPQEPEWHPEGDVWTHIKHCVDALVEKTSWTEKDESARCILLLAVLMHDLGKARCTRYAMKNEKLRWISPGHDQAGVDLSERLLRRMGAPNSVIQCVGKLIANHHFLNAFKTESPSSSSMRRLARRLSPATIEDLELVMRADHLGRPPLVSEKQKARLAFFAEKAEELSIENAAPDTILKGRHLIETGLEPNTSFKAILSQAYEEQLDGAFHDLEGAKIWLNTYLGNKDNNS